jgi:hypothetical protein
LSLRNTSIEPPIFTFINPILEEDKYQIEWKNKNQDATIILPSDTVYKSVQVALTYNGKIDSLKITNDKQTKDPPAKDTIVISDSIMSDSIVSDSIVPDNIVKDSIIVKPENFTTIQFNLSSESDLKYAIFQVLDTKDVVVDEIIHLDTNRTVIFKELKPASYKFRLIFDENLDQEWTPGNIFENQYPEKVLYFEKTLKLEKNFEYEEDWEL